jgi:hypothetical protein
VSTPDAKFTPLSLPGRLRSFAVLAGVCALLIISPAGQRSNSPKLPDGCACSGEVPSGCTVFTVSKGEQVFFGGNDDFINPDSYYWVDPGGASGYGAIWIGRPDNVQQGVNEKGLAYDANGLPRVDVNPHRELTPVPGDYTIYPIKILRECATVEEVIAWVKTHQWHSYMHDQMQFADARGEAVVISAGADGELVFSRKPPGDSYLVSTNFNVANPDNGYGQDSRYSTAQRQLGRLLSQEGELTAQDAASVLDAVHQAGGTSWTIESLVADLPNGIVYLYYFYQFDKPLVLSVAEEIADPHPPGPLSRLFPEDVQQEAARRYQRIQTQGSRCLLFGKIWLGLVLVSLIGLLIGSIKQRQGWIFWIPVVVILGPLGWLVWLVAGREHKAGSWRAVRVEATGDVAPTVVAFMIFLVVAISMPAVQASDIFQFLLIFGLPPLVGCLVFHGPLLAVATKTGYGHTLLQRLPQVWVTANLGMAGIDLLAATLVNRSLRSCAALPLPPWTVVGWWGLTVIGAVLGMLLLLLFEGWAVRGGFQAWSVLASGHGEVTTPGWRRLWAWILLSYLALFAGIIGMVLLQSS